jgi:hypothetical protein
VSFGHAAPGKLRHARSRSDMAAPLEYPAEEIKHLQRCINDLVSILALPAMWTGAEPSQVVSTLLDTLFGMPSRPW